MSADGRTQPRQQRSCGLLQEPLLSLVADLDERDVGETGSPVLVDGLDDRLQVGPARKEAAMSRIAIFVYGILCYAIFFAVFLYGIGFIGGLGTPTMLDGAARRPTGEALAIDLGILAAFAIQHSGMARPAF